MKISSFRKKFIHFLYWKLCFDVYKGIMQISVMKISSFRKKIIHFLYWKLCFDEIFVKMSFPYHYRTIHRSVVVSSFRAKTGGLILNTDTSIPLETSRVTA